LALAALDQLLDPGLGIRLQLDRAVVRATRLRCGTLVAAEKNVTLVVTHRRPDREGEHWVCPRAAPRKSIIAEELPGQGGPSSLRYNRPIAACHLRTA